MAFVELLISELRLNTSNPENVYITDLNKEGVFRLDPLDLTSPDNGAIIIVNSSNKRYKRIYEGFIYPQWFGAKADGTSDDRLAIQAMLDYPVLDGYYFPNTGSAYRTSDFIYIRSNSTIVLEAGVEIFGMGTNTNHLLRLENVENVNIDGYGATLKDIKESYPTNSEFYGGISVRSANNVCIKGLTIRDTGGDGIYFGSFNSLRIPSKNVRIENVNIYNTNRNGISVTNNDGLWITNCAISSVKGTPPQAGIDLEPNDPIELIRNINITNLLTQNCAAAGIIIAIGQLTGRNDVSINITNHSDIGSRYAFYTGRYTGDIKGVINVTNPIWRNNISVAYLNNGTNPDGIRINIYDPVIENPHYTNDMSENGMYAAMFFYRHTGSVYPLPTLGGVHIYRPYIVDNVIPEGDIPRVPVNGFLFRDFESKPWTNITIDSPKKIQVPNDKIKIYHGTGIKVNDDYGILHKSFTGSGEHFTIVNLQTGGNNNYVKTITNRYATGNNIVEFAVNNPDLYEFEMAIESNNRVTLIFPVTHSCPELQQGTSTGFYSDIVGSRLKLRYNRDEKRFLVLDIQGKWYARNNDNLAIDNGALYIDSNTILPKGISYGERNGIIIVKSVPNTVSDLNLTHQSRNKNQYVFIKRDADTNGNVVRIYVNDSITGTIGSINNSGRTLHCLSAKGDAILLWSDGLDYKIVNWYRNSMTAVTSVAATPTRTELNTQYGYEKEGFALYNTTSKATYTKLSLANNSAWIKTDWDTGVTATVL